MIEFLNQNSGLFTLIFSGIVAISTIVYAFLTAKAVYETRRMRKLQNDPFISVIIRPSDIGLSFIYIEVQNIGLGPAYDIKFEIDNNMKILKNKSILDINIFKDGIKYLSPGQKISSFLTSMIENYNDKCKIKINIKSTYKSTMNEIKTSINVLDFSQFVGTMKLGNPPLHQISKDIEKIRERIDDITRGFSKLNVNTFNSKDRKDEGRLLEEQIKEQQNQIDASTE